MGHYKTDDNDMLRIFKEVAAIQAEHYKISSFSLDTHFSDGCFYFVVAVKVGENDEYKVFNFFDSSNKEKNEKTLCELKSIIEHK